MKIFILFLFFSSYVCAQNADTSVSCYGNYTTIGNNETITITVHNNGPDTAENVAVTLSSISCFNYVSSNVPVGSFANNVWTIGSVENGQTITMTAIYNMISFCNCSYLFVAQLTTTTNDPNTFQASPAANYNWDISTDIEVQCTPVISNLYNGATIYLNYVLKNNNFSDACGGIVYFSNISGLTIVDAIVSSGNWNNVGRYWDVNLFNFNLVNNIQLECLVTDYSSLSIKCNGIQPSGSFYEYDMNNNSCFTQFTNLSSTKFEVKNSIFIVPNPASNFITIDNKNNLPINAISIADTNGRIVLETKNATSTIDINDLSKGIYLVNITSEFGNSVKKLVKE